MQNPGEIILIEDDEDDVELFSNIIEELKTEHELIVFSTIEKAFEYMKSRKGKPFIMVCDINWRSNTQEKIRAAFEKFPELKLKHIPFILYSSAADNLVVNKAFDELNVQGFFEKRANPAEMRTDISLILNYWERSKEPQLD